MTLSPRTRKLLLTAHVTTSVGWCGALAVFIAHALIAVVSREEQLVRAMSIAMGLTAWLVIMPLSLATLGTGLAQALGIAWGLLRHYLGDFQAPVDRGGHGCVAAETWAYQPVGRGRQQSNVLRFGASGASHLPRATRGGGPGRVAGSSCAGDLQTSGTRSKRTDRRGSCLWPATLGQDFCSPYRHPDTAGGDHDAFGWPWARVTRVVVSQACRPTKSRGPMRSCCLRSTSPGSHSSVRSRCVESSRSAHTA